MNYVKMSRWMIFILCLGSISVSGQNPTGPSMRRPQSQTDTSRSQGPGALRKPAVPKPYDEVITKNAIKTTGMFIVQKVDDKYYFEIPNDLLKREILVVNRLAKSGADMRASMSGYAGDQINQGVIIFDKGPNHKIFLREISYSEISKDSTKPMFKAVKNSNVQPIAYAFDIKAYSPDKNRSVIDVTDFLNSDNDILFFEPRVKTTFRLGALQSDKSYIDGVNTFPSNIEIKTVKTYSRTSGSPADASGRPTMRESSQGGGTTTVELNSSLVLLPRVPMKPRYFDPRVGYFAASYTDFDAKEQSVERTSMISRWRLEPKPEDVEKYKRGELVEPQKPIIFYIDPSTPPKWVPYLIAGINDWQVAFEAAGFKNAIQGKVAPAKSQDSTWSIEDARYSAIVYKPSDVENASGPHVHDPRSGEILESHVNWYHNVMKLLHDWYFVQCSPLDLRARTMEFDDKLMGQLVRFVSSHEVGHTLGLRHNFGASSTTPVEKLRDKAWVEAHGHTSSIMDYARFNYVAQPQDSIKEAGLFPRINDYDKWAIEWGYRWFPEFKTPEDETPYLNKWIIEKSKDPRLWFGTETNPDDPRSQSEDLGDNAMKANAYGVKNLKVIINNLEDWTKTPTKGYSNLKELYKAVNDQFNRYLGHVSKNIAGIYEDPKSVEQPGDVYQNVPFAKQKEAFKFLDEQIFTTPKWLLVNSILNKTGDKATEIVSTLQNNVLNRVMTPNNFDKLVRAEATDGASAYKVSDLLYDFHNSVWNELKTRKAIDIYRMQLQNLFIDKTSDLLKESQQPAVTTSPMARFGNIQTTLAPTSPAYAMLKNELRKINREIKTDLPLMTDAASKAHLENISDLIKQILEPKQ